MSTEAGSVTQLLDLLQVVDRSFPTGSFVHSHGLEWLVKNSSLDFERSLHLRLQQQLARFELIFLVHAYAALGGVRPHPDPLPEGEGTYAQADPQWAAGIPGRRQAEAGADVASPSGRGRPSPARTGEGVPSRPVTTGEGVPPASPHPTQLSLASIDARLNAMLLPREAREASMRVGRQLLNAAHDLHGGAELGDARDSLPYAHHPIVFGVVGRTLGLEPRTAATVYAFQSVRGQISAAQRLTRLGQVEAQRLLHRLKPAIEEAADLAFGQPLQNAAPFMPLLDVASMAHERMAVRLFVS